MNALTEKRYLTLPEPSAGDTLTARERLLAALPEAHAKCYAVPRLEEAGFLPLEKTVYGAAFSEMAALIFVGIILVMITYARYKFPVPKVGTPPAAQQPRGQNAGK